MKFLVFALVYPLIWLISRLPMYILYLISDFFFFILYYIIGYRKKVVLNNLKLAFPKKSEQELKTISKKFFKHFTNLMIESIKAFSISEKEIKKRYKYTNANLVNELSKDGKSIALVGAHQANWEWSTSVPLHLDIKVFGAYTKLQNPYFEKVVLKSRSKFGVKGYKTTNTVKAMSFNFANNIQGAYVLLSDQSPQLHKTHHWQTFLNVFVPVHTGAEMLAKKFDMSVVHYSTKKIKRGYYETTFEIVEKNCKDIPDYKITDKYLKIVEKHIKEQPEFYLWSHKRFKRKDMYEEWLQLKKKAKK